MKRFVVTGIGRSGTKYTSDLFTAAEVPTSWEKAFRVNGRNPKFTGGGDSSWLSAPFLAELLPDTVVLHQTRDPLAWLNSWLKSTGHWPRAHKLFVNEHSRLFRWDRSPRPQSDMRVFVQWHRMIENQVQAGGFPYLRFKVEDLDLAKMQEIATLIDAPFKPQKASQALAKTSKKTNTSDRPNRPNHSRRVPNQANRAPAAPEPPKLLWADLPAGRDLDDFKALAVEYGYGVIDE